MVNPTNNCIISVKFDTDVWYRDEIAYNLKTTGQIFLRNVKFKFYKSKKWSYYSLTSRAKTAGLCCTV